MVEEAGTVFLDVEDFGEPLDEEVRFILAHPEYDPRVDGRQLNSWRDD